MHVRCERRELCRFGERGSPTKRIEPIYRLSQVPTLVPKPASPTVTQEHLPRHEFTALRSVRSPWVMLDREICSLKIRVSVVRLTRIGSGRSSPCGQLRCPDSLRESVRPWPPLSHGVNRSLSLSKYPRSYSRKLTSQIWSSTSRMPTFEIATQSKHRMLGKSPNWREFPGSREKP